MNNFWKPPRPCILGVIVATCIGMTWADENEDIQKPRNFLLVVGAGGDASYTDQFHAWADRWKAFVSSRPEARYHEIGRDPDDQGSDKGRLQRMIETLKDEEGESTWLVLIGHGTFDRDVAKFNLRGPDVSARELNQWTSEWKNPLIVINCASSSGPFVNRLSGAKRVIVTATRSGQEQNFARFGEYLSLAISDLRADLDHDDEVSLREACIMAAGNVASFYESDGRLATEHAILDDNADQLGTEVRKLDEVDSPQADGLMSSRIFVFQSDNACILDSQQQQKRAALEQQLDALKQRKSELAEDDYYEQLKTIMIDLAKLYVACQ
ncbi:MAG: hypothetical protein R3C05_18415 [Pirellulaceae bacterium]